MVFAKIENYSVTFSANRYNPKIILMNAALKYIGALYFYPAGTVLPEDKLSSNGLPMLNYHIDKFPMLIDLLRNESPLYLEFNGSGHGFENSVRVWNEQVGDGERV